MKYVSKISFMAVSLFLTCTYLLNAQVLHNDLSEMKLQGNIKQLTQNTYKAVERMGEVQKSGRVSKLFGPENQNLVLHFNSFGNISTRINYDAQGEYQGRIIYQYNRENLKVEEIGYGANEAITDRSLLEYNTRENTLTTRINYFGLLDSAVSIKYFVGSRKIVLHDWYDKSGQLIERITFCYDDNGNLFEQSIYNPKGDLVSKTTSQYDEKARNIQVTKVSSYAKPSTYHYKFDAFGNVIEEWIDIQNKISYRYKYDENNNWIERIRFHGNLPLEVTERVLQYY